VRYCDEPPIDGLDGPPPGAVEGALAPPVVLSAPPGLADGEPVELLPVPEVLPAPDVPEPPEVPEAPPAPCADAIAGARPMTAIMHAKKSFFMGARTSFESAATVQ
jgi:hypothetical protein